METKNFYYFILVVYSFLWFCQMVTCHLTHSLIVLTDSYINLYKILEISLGLLHLKLQHDAQECKKINGQPLATIYSKFFNRTCTYQYKRLPVLGSFVNSLFLAALLMSAAIEGIQTCFHASHSSGEEKSILLQNQITYPAVLVGFALVGVLMQWCSDKAHQMRDKELANQSVSNTTRKTSQTLELNPSSLLNKTSLSSNSLPNDTNSVLKDSQTPTPQNPPDQDDAFESIPLDTNDTTEPRVEYLKLEQKSPNTSTFKVNAKDIEANHKAVVSEESNPMDFSSVVRYCVSPVSLILCSLIIYFINDELITEVGDALLAVVIVVLLFGLSYPPMKRASKILLQSAPVQFPLEKLKLRIKSASGAIIEVRNLHVWSLTANNNPIATCDIVLREEDFTSERTLTALIRDVRCKFLEENIECCTVQPVFVSQQTSQEASEQVK